MLSNINDADIKENILMAEVQMKKHGNINDTNINVNELKRKLFSSCGAE